MSRQVVTNLLMELVGKKGEFYMPYALDIVPDYIRQRYPYAKDLQDAMNRGEVLRDRYGNLVLAHQPPLTHTQCYPANYGFIPCQNVSALYPANAQICQQPYSPLALLYCAQAMERNRARGINR